MRSSLVVLAAAASVAAQNSTSNTTLASALTSNPDLSQLATIATNFGLVSQLSQLTNVTILAPSNNAFSKFLNSTGGNTTAANKDLLTAILSYHILNGTINSSQITSNPSFVPSHLTSQLLTNVTGGQRVEALSSGSTVSILSGFFTNSTVTQANIPFNNGIIHVIDTVLKPPTDVASTAEHFNLTAVAGALTTLNLLQTVATTPDLTIFAPSNNAFQAIASVLTNNASTDTLTSVLKYHVVPGKVLYSPDITNTTIKTLNGASLNVAVVGGSVFINQAKVIVPNVLVANGVVHVIDNVLNPATNATAGSNSTAFSGATSATGVPFTSGVSTPTAAPTIPTQVTATTTGSGSSSSSSSTNVGAKAMATGAIGAGMLFAGALLAL